MNTKTNDLCGCTNCPKNGCLCGCQSATVTATPNYAGMQCGCGGSCRCEGAKQGCHCPS